MNNNVLKPFISTHLPEFIVSDNPTFKAFIEAYYEFLEKRNDSESINVKELFKSVHNPAGIVNNITATKDIDETLDQFIRYFKKEVLPFAIETSAVKDRFLVKKIRDVYLSKGSPKSFELLFRMLYNEEIDIFETRDNIMELSEGKFLSFPLATFKVVNYSNNLDKINFSLANLSHSDDGFITDSDVAIVLSGQILGKTKDSDNASVINVQLNFAFNVDDSEIYRITDPTNPRIFIDVKPILSLVNLKAKNNAPGYVEGDIIKVKSLSLNKTFNVVVENVNRGSVTGLHFRDRGEFFKPGDSFVFTPSSPADGSGGTATVTNTDKNGRITEVDGYNVRTGRLNNGYLADDFENVIVPVINGGSYKFLPEVSISRLSTTSQGLPYSKGPTSAQGPNFSPVSTSIGTIANFSIYDRGFFADKNDVLIQAPMNVTVEGLSELQQGQLVTFQYLDQRNNSFFNDSDRVDISLKLYRTVDSDTKYNIKTIKLPYNFDSEIFQWIDSDFNIDSDNGLSTATAKWKQLVDSETTINYEIVEDSDQGFKVRIYNKFINGLDDFHFNQLNNYVFNDSDFTFNWRNDFKNPNLGVDSEVARWVDTGYFGIVNRVSPTKKVVSLLPAVNRNFPSDSDLDGFDNVKNRILRIAAFSQARQEIIIRNNKPLSNIVAFHSRAEFEPVLSSTAISDRTFVNEDGFLNSLSGGVVQDNYFYSYYTYIIQSNLSIDLWRDKIKRTLHPAGMLMFAETNLNQNINIPLNMTAKSFNEQFKTTFTFDTMLDHYSDPVLENRVTADNTRYEANAFIFYNQVTSNLYALTASSYERGYDEAYVSEHGSSWFDYEPMGLVRKEQVNYDGVYNNFTYFDSDTLLRTVTTQDSDSDGYVSSLRVDYKKFNNTVQDFYKKESRTRRSYDPVEIASTNFRDPLNDLYTVYDSDLPLGFHVRWSDSDILSFQAIDYGRLKSTNDTRTFKWFNSDRKKEMLFKKENDLNKAMRLDGTLTFTEQNGTVYKDLEAYEKIWNEINSLREDSEGWQVNGYSSFIQNYKAKPRFLYENYIEKRKPDYRKFKTPFKPIVWDNTDSDNIVWNNHYNPPEDAILNNSSGTIFDWNYTNVKGGAQYWRDPNTSMSSRKVK